MDPAAVLDPRLNRVHRALARRRRPVDREAHEQWLQRCMSDGPEGLNRRQLNALARDADALGRLHRAAWTAPRDSYWGERVGVVKSRDYG